VSGVPVGPIPSSLVPITDEQLIFLLLRGSTFPTGRELAEFVEEGVYFDDDPRFIPGLDELDDAPLEQLTIVWDEDRPPVIIQRVSPAELEQTVGEVKKLLQTLPEEPNERIHSALDALPKSRHLVRITVDAETMTDEAWAMLDSLEAHLARTYAGLVYVPGDGVFDADLQPIYRRPPK